MRNAAYISAGMHIFVISMIYFGLPTLFAPESSREVPVAVEILEVGDVPLRARSRPAPQEADDSTPVPEQLAPASKGAPPTPPPPPPRQVARIPDAVPVPRQKPVKEPPPLPRRKPQVAMNDPAPKPKPKPKPPPDEFDVLLRNLSKEAEAKRKQPESKPKPKDESLLPKDLLASRNKRRRELSIDDQRLVGTLAQMVISQITPCWSIPVGAKDAEEMQVGITISLNPDGSLRGIPRIDDQSRMVRDPFFRAVAESALRALRNPRCTPLRLPLKNYETWREISFNFDPKEVLGQ